GTLPASVSEFAEKSVTGASPYDQMTSLAAAVREAFKYDPSSAAGQSYGRLNTLVTYGKDKDHPSAASADAFATLFATAARASGMPSRLVVGFVAKPAAGAGPDAYQVAGPDVRVWPEVYFTGVGWVPFYAAVPDGDANGSGEQPVHVQPTGAPSTPDSTNPSQSTPSYSGPSVHVSDPDSDAGGSSVLPVIAAVAAGLVVLALLGYAAFGALVRRRRRSARRGDPDPRRRTEWAWLDSLDALGYPPRSTVTPREVADGAPTALGDEGTEPIQRLAGLAELAAYAPRPPRPEQADEAWGHAERIRVLARRRTPRRVRVVRALRPPGAGRERRH
ncbi:MAG: transglutaminase domain-containing protein, partial [Catenulispora sp.]|nr:transglutaminase domain-containing protein [Catenulispora sp.]